jgi:hypothetical protein
MTQPTDFDAVMDGIEQVKDVEGVTHTLRNPDLCLVLYPGERVRYTLERGSVIEEQAQIPARVPEGAEDVAATLVDVVALAVAQVARQHDRQVIRVARRGNGPQVAAALREAGFYVVEFE